MRVAVDFPETTSVAQLDPAYLKQALVATLYQIGKLSEHEACLTLQITRREFEALLPQFGFSILSDDQANIEIELRA
ncbi:MAG: UPF0175 family protein [Chloroflexi bacterium]|nr:UPF0175 family protein [Chloroflexota bacterium]